MIYDSRCQVVDKCLQRKYASIETFMHILFVQLHPRMMNEHQH